MERQGEKRRRVPGKGGKRPDAAKAPAPVPDGAEWTPGALIAGFRVESVTPLHEQDETAFLLVHERTGMQWLHFRADDPVSSCAIAVATPVSDNRGLPHVLEHLVYEGSKRFPGTDLMREMEDRTAVEGMNGTTGPFMTFYHFSSALASDMRALFQVWFDAILAPELSDEAFLREAGRFRPADPNHPEGPLSFTGVVFNEMRDGSLDDDDRIMEAVGRKLVPDTPFGFDSGGVPADLMTLTPDDVRAYHRKWYCPANLRVVTRGSDMPSCLLAEADRRLEGVEPGEAAPPFRPQPRWNGVRETEIAWPVSEWKPGRAPPKPQFARIWLVPCTGYPEERSIAWNLFKSVFDFPFVAGVVDSDRNFNPMGPGRFKALSGSYGPDAYWGFFGCPDEDEEEASEAILGSIEDFLDEPTTADRIRRAAKDAEERIVRAINDGKGTAEDARRWGFRSILSDWLLSGDPLRSLSSSSSLGLCFRFHRNPEAALAIVRDILFRHPHRLDVVLRPEPGAEDPRDAAIAAVLAERRKMLSDEECAELARRDAALASDPPPSHAEDLPKTDLADLAPDMVSFRYEATTDSISRATFVHVRENPRGEAWMVAFADLRDLTSEQLLFLPFVLEAARNGRDGDDSRFKFAPSFYSNVLTGSFVHGIRVTTPLYFRNIEDDVERFSKLFRVRDPLTFQRAFRSVWRWAQRRKTLDEWRQSYMRTHVWATRATAEKSLLAACNDGSFLDHYIGFRVATTRPDKDPDPEESCDGLASGLVRDAAQVADLLHNPARWTFSLIGPRHIVLPFRSKLLSVLRAAPPEAVGPAAEQKFAPRTDAEESREACPNNDQRTSSISVSIPAPADSVLDRRLFEIGAGLVERDIAFRKIRREIGAYHVEFEWRDNAFLLESNDNPDIAATLGSLDRFEKDIAAAEWSPEDVRRAALRTARRYLLRPLPAEIAQRSLFRHLSGATPERILEELRAMANLEPGAIKRALMRAIRSGLRIASVRVEANEKDIAEANQHLPPDRRIRLSGEDGALGEFD